MFSKIDQDKYFNMLKAVASMSSLYSSQDSPLIHYRFIENLFTKTSLIKAELIAHKDMSFDCRLENKVGVGIKTFVSKSQNYCFLLLSYAYLAHFALKETLQVTSGNDASGTLYAHDINSLHKLCQIFAKINLTTEKRLKYVAMFSIFASNPN